MPEDEDRNEQVPGHPKEASVTIYLVEELGDARLRCDQLVRYVTEAVRLIETSPHRDKFYETAGHLLHAAPLTLFKLQKALQAVALAANRIDYEELRVELRPEKVQQLERVLEDVRIRQINRHSEPLMNPQQVAAKLHQIAATTREFQLPQDEVVGLIVALERGDKKADESVPLADLLDKFADSLVTPHKEGEKPSRFRLASVLRRMVGDVRVKGHLAALAVTATDCGKEGCDCDKEGGCDKQAVPPGIAGKAATWAVETADKVNVNKVKTLIKSAEEVLKEMGSALDKYSRGGKFEPQLGNAQTDARSLMSLSKRMLRAMGVKTAKFEEGEKADKDNDGVPDNIKDEKAKEEWKAENAKHKDKFKGATEQKQTGFAEGEKADKDGDGVPDNIKDEKAKKDWKENTDEFGDKFKDKKAEDWKVTATLKPKDKKVVEAFQAKKPLKGSLVSTDGKKLIKNGMGGGTFAEWKGSKIVLDPNRPMVKNDEPIIRYMKKAIPKGDLADHPNLRSATEQKQTGFAEGEKADKDGDGVPDNIKDEKAKKDWKENTDEFGDKFKKDKKAAQPWEAAELKDMEALLKKQGYDPKDAKKLQREGIGPHELEHRMKTTTPGEMGSLEYTHGLKKKGNMLEGVGLPPERVEALNEAGRRNHEAIFGDPNWKA